MTLGGNGELSIFAKASLDEYFLISPLTRACTTPHVPFGRKQGRVDSQRKQPVGLTLVLYLNGTIVSMKLTI